MICLDAYKEAFHHLPEGAAEAEVNAEIHHRMEVAVRDGVSAGVQYSQKTELFIRVSGTHTGYAYTQNLEDPAAELLSRAFENSLYSDRTEPDFLNRCAVQRDFGENQAISDGAVLESLAADLCEELRAGISQRLAAAKGVCRDFSLSLTVGLAAETFGMKTVNSHGLDVQSFRPLYILNLSAGLQNGAENSSAALSVQKRDPALFDREAICCNLADRLRWQIAPQPGFSSGNYPVILSEEAAYTLFATAWQEFSAYKYLDGACALSGKLGEKVAGSCLSVTDYVQTDDTGFQIDCDAEGTVSRDAILLDHGVMTGLMHNTATAAALGCENTGNAGRRSLLFGNIATDLLVIPKNFCIEPGVSSLEEMEAHMQNGILITEYFDVFHSLDISSGNFSVPCFGVRIRDGHEDGNLTALTLSGNFRDLLMNIEEVGCRRFVRPMIDLENYAIGACALRIRELSVSGE